MLIPCYEKLVSAFGSVVFLGLVRQCRRTFSFIVQKPINLGNGPIEDNDGELMIGNVQNQILTHNGQTDETEVTTGDDPRGSADIDAGQTGATVSSGVPSTQFKAGRLHWIGELPYEGTLPVRRPRRRHCGAAGYENKGSGTYIAVSAILGWN